VQRVEGGVKRGSFRERLWRLRGGGGGSKGAGGASNLNVEDKRRSVRTGFVWGWGGECRGMVWCRVLVGL